MTHDPSRLATAEQIINGNSPFETVDTPLGTMERWRAEAMLIGTTGGMQSVFEAIRSDSAARADEAQARTALIQHLCAQVDALTSRCDALASELETFKAKERADAKAAAQAEEERQRALEEDPLEDPPLAEYQARNPPSEIGDDTPAPSGELHALPPNEEPEVEDDDTDNIGDLPPELVEEPDPVPPPRGSVYPQPVSISLNEK
jgi:hypothetical protein